MGAPTRRGTQNERAGGSERSAFQYEKGPSEADFCNYLCYRHKEHLMIEAIQLTKSYGAFLAMDGASFKEAQNYLTPLMFVIMVPAMVVGFLPDLVPPLWMYIVPVLRQALVILELLEGTPEAVHLILSTASTAVYAVLSLSFVIRTFSREQILLRQA